MKATTAILLASGLAVIAQNATFPCLIESELDKKIPECARSCQHTALLADGCDYENVGCHCLKTAFLGTILIPCLSNSTCTMDDLTEFDSTISPVCAYFNATNSGAIPEPECDSKPTATSSFYPASPETTSGDGEETTSILTYWEKPTPTGSWIYPSSSSAPSTPSSNSSGPLQYWGNGASSSKVIGNYLMVVVCGIAALLL